MIDLDFLVNIFKRGASDAFFGGSLKISFGGKQLLVVALLSEASAQPDSKCESVNTSFFGFRDD